MEEIEREIRELEDRLHYEVPDPLYLQPTDIPAFNEQIKRHASLLPTLTTIISTRRAAGWKDELSRRQQYRKQYDGWRRGVERVERERNETHLFEEAAPKPPTTTPSSLLPTTTSNTAALGSRSRSRGDVVRSEEELNRVLQALLEQERENPATRWMSTLATIPPMSTDSSAFLDTNTLIDPSTRLSLPTTEFIGAWSPVWTAAEERLFVEKYLHYPKNFAKIAQFLGPDKTRGACVQFYYRNKKRLKLKQRLQAHRKNAATGSSTAVVRKKVGRPPRSQQPKKPSLIVADEEEEEDEDAAILSDTDY